MTEYGKTRRKRAQYGPYMIAAALAMVTTMLVAPEKIEGNGMEPALHDGQVIIMTKESYSAKRGSPELGQVVVIEKWVGEDVFSDNIVARVSALPGEKVPQEDGTVITLKDGEVYLLCDNPDAEGPPMDSRTVGPVSMRDIRGDAKWIVWPLTNIGGID